MFTLFNKKIQNLLNIKLLETFIINKNYKPFIEKITKNTTININKNKKFINMLKNISTLYKVRIKIIRVSEDEDKSSCYVGGEYSRQNKTISIRLSKNGSPKISILLYTFCHELAHHLQYKLVEDSYWPKKLFYVLLYERAADMLAYSIYCTHFKDWNVLTKRSFNAYENEKDISWLIQYKNGTLENYDYSK